ncbi:hypothetical protein BN1708_009522 [Verticillium longisporum]|uniref:Aminoglycoside phosphotransferase domain-containing protein n=2 Tax=Verticillium longisporum TaxID=100787 RepID=A0A0G4KJ28_VERLO|nr:hypothetical protein BN1708_009522 [Verticillium longisporum]
MATRIVWEQTTQNLYDHLWAEHQRRAISSLAALHVGLDPERQHQRCVVQEPDGWIRGNFNICVPVHVLDKAGSLIRRVLVRCPMGHKLAEDRHPGTVDEKLSTEVATYAWMQENCPEVPIPALLGFGFTDGRHFTHVQWRPFYVRWARALWRRMRMVLRLPVLSQYVPVLSDYALQTGYIVLDYIEPKVGKMLSTTWEMHRNDAERRQTLFRGLSRLMLTVARLPLPRIGSWHFHDDGTITLSNRPLTCNLVILENNGAPRIIQPGDTYTCVEPYIWDLLTLHDGRLHIQPNAAMDEADCRYQMAVQVLLRTLAYGYFDRDRRHGPFVMQFSDLHASNIFVDSHWNITAVIDLEWICARPIEMIDVPYWITGLGIDQIGKKEHIDEYAKTREEFITILGEEERNTAILKLPNVSLAAAMRRAGECKSSWFVYCLDSVNAMYTLFDQHLRPQFISFDLTEKMNFFLSKFWCEKADELVDRKLRQKHLYDIELRRMFENDVDATPLVSGKA